MCANLPIADKREFIKISQAVGIGFVIMGVIGFIVKLSKATKLSIYKLNTLLLTELPPSPYPSQQYFSVCVLSFPLCSETHSHQQFASIVVIRNITNLFLQRRCISS